MVGRRAGVAPCNLKKRDFAPCLAAPLGHDSPVSESSTSREKGATRKLPVAPVFGPDSGRPLLEIGPLPGAGRVSFRMAWSLARFV
jgi:hypothetical protein